MYDPSFFLVMAQLSHLMTKPTKMAYVPSEDSDQPGHLPSLIRAFAVRMKKAWVFSYPLSAQRRLIRLGGCPGWSESLFGAHAILLVLSWGGPENNYRTTHTWYDDIESHPNIFFQFFQAPSNINHGTFWQFARIFCQNGDKVFMGIVFN